MKRKFEVTFESNDDIIIGLCNVREIKETFAHSWDYEDDPKITVRLIEEDNERKATVSLFKDSGKWYCDEEWTIPEKAIGPWAMADSPDFRRIGNGKVLVPTQEPFGFPVLL